jgi:hypothetical protein
MPRNALIQLRRDTAANWTSTNPTLASGEMGFETDTGKFKIGTGSTAWSSLLYTTDASDITGATLASNVTGSSLTSVGTLGSLAVTNDITRGGISLPRGVMAYNAVTSSDTTVTTAEEVQIIGSSFTAILDRIYKITYYEPNVYGAGAPNYLKLKIRQTDISGTILVQATPYVAAVFSGGIMASSVISTVSGTVNFVATAQANSGTNQCVRSSTQPAYLLVEDIGAVSDNNNN